VVTTFTPVGGGHTYAYLEAYVAREQRGIPGDGWTGLRKIGRTPAGTAVLADIPSAERNTGEVFVNTAPGTYEVYAGDTGG
jgi:hypothetical protein